MSEILKAGIRYVHEHTLYNMMRSSPDFEDVKAALNERMGWSIELVSIFVWPIVQHHSPLHELLSSFVVASREEPLPSLHDPWLTIPRSIHLTSGGSPFMPGALLFLFMAENIHIQYGQLSPAQLKVCVSCVQYSDPILTIVLQERAEHIGYATFALLFAVLDVGFVIVRVAALVALSGSSALATSLVLISMSPSVLPVLTYPASLFKRRKCGSDIAVKMESDTVVDGTGTGAS